MSFVGDFIGDVVGGITGAKQAGKAAEQAGQLQYAAAMEAVEEQRRQFDKLVDLMAPFVTAGEEAIPGMKPYAEVGAPALEQQAALSGLRGPAAQRAAIQQIERSPEMQAMIQQGENALLQQASATGGLRGGNVQAALAQFRPQVLSDLIGQQYSRLGGLTEIGRVSTENLARLGQASAAGQAASGMSMASNVGTLLGEGAAARAGGVLARGNVARQSFGDILDIGKMAAGFF